MEAQLRRELEEIENQLLEIGEGQR
jgi:hypothetical protein